MKQFMHHYPLSILTTLLIVFLSLCPFFPDTGLEEIPLIDKWVHFVMYGGLCLVIWWETPFSPTQALPRGEGLKKSSLLGGVKGAVLFPLLLSGAMELMQAYCTTTRNGDWGDMAANAIGVLLGTVVGRGIVFPLRRRYGKSK